MPNDPGDVRTHEISTEEAADHCAFERQALEILCQTGKIVGARFHRGAWVIPRTVLPSLGGGDAGGRMFTLPWGALDARP